ncbi:Hsp20/alpha crystallin family protein [Saliphagus sp. GCM10025308]
MSALRDALRDLSDAAFFDLLESDDSYLLVLDVPGVAAETVDVAVEDGRIRIEARRQKDLPEEYHYLEENRPLFVDVDLPCPTTRRSRTPRRASIGGTRTRPAETGGIR